MLDIGLFIFCGDLWPTISKMKEIDEKLDTVVCSALIIVPKGDYRRMWEGLGVPPLLDPKAISGYAMVICIV